jgi:hypothetical protein
MGEVTGLNIEIPLGINVGTVEAKTNDIAGVGVGASALTVVRLPVLWGQTGEVNLYRLGLDFRNRARCCVFVLGATAEFNRALAVVVPLHRQPANAFA